MGEIGTADGGLPARSGRPRLERGRIPAADRPASGAQRASSRAFPGCLANDRVDLQVMPGEIHALLGENGAGKSTLVKIIYGVLQPDAGEIRWQRRADLAFPARTAARKLGIGMVFQHFSLFEALTVAENIALAIDDQAARRRPALAHRRGLARPMACRSIPTAPCTIFRSASASASRSCAACCRIRSC